MVNKVGIYFLIPFKKFNLKNIKEVKKCCHYTNLQPLWWHENLSKSNKLDTEWN